MVQSLINLKDNLKKVGFKFEASSSLYNPMERFADYVSTKEIVHSKIYNGNNGLKAEVSSKYPSYCYIWNSKAYGKTCLWLAIGFDYGSYSVYIVSNNVDIEKYPEYLAKLKLGKSSQDNEGHWHKPIKTESFVKKFMGKPKCEEIKSDIDTWLEHLNEVAEIK